MLCKGWACGSGGGERHLDVANFEALTGRGIKGMIDDETHLRLSARTRTVLLQSIVLALGIKAVFLVLALTGQATLWMALFRHGRKLAGGVQWAAPAANARQVHSECRRFDVSAGWQVFAYPHDSEALPDGASGKEVRMDKQSPFITGLLIVFAVIGLLAALTVLGMLFMHDGMTA